MAWQHSAIYNVLQKTTWLTSQSTITLAPLIGLHWIYYAYEANSNGSSPRWTQLLVRVSSFVHSAHSSFNSDDNLTLRNSVKVFRAAFRNVITVCNSNRSTQEQTLTVLWEQCHVRHVRRPHNVFHFGQLYACQCPVRHNTQRRELSPYMHM